MSSNGKAAGEATDRELEEALGSFRQCVHAWSETALSRPRAEAQAARPRSWRLAAAWVLGGVLAAVSLSGSLYERHHRQDLARIAAAQAARQRQLAAQERAQADRNLLTTVNYDISQAVPQAMEPLADLMDAGANQ
jgi:hypothetical protein